MTDGPYPLPPGWRWVRLGEVCIPIARRDPTKYPDASFFYIDISSIDNTAGQITSFKELKGSEAPSRARKIIYTDDIIFATTRPYLKNIALVPPELNDQICSTGFCVIRANREVADPRYLFYVCRSPCIIKYLDEAKMRGASYPAVTDNDVYEALIPLPPLDEQRRIVAKVEMLMERVREAKRLRSESRIDADTLTDAALSETFRREELQNMWPKIEDMCEIRGGLQKSPKRTPKANPRPYLRVANVQRGYLDLQDIAYFEVSDPELERYRLLAGDVLIIEGNGSPDLVGRTAIFRGEIKDCVHQNHVIRLRPKTSHVLPEFLSAYLTSTSGREIIRELSHTSSGLLNLSVGKIRTIPVPPLPISEQRRIVAHLDSVQAQVTALKQAQEATDAELHRLEQAILDRAFRGEL